jgi:hypothetical protein
MDRKYEPNTRIAELCRGMTQREFGESIKATGRQVCGYLSGEKRAPLEIRRRLARKFGGTERDYRQKPKTLVELRKTARSTDDINHPLRNAIYLSGITPRELTELAGYSESFMGGYIMGRDNLGLKTARRLARIIGCCPEDILPEPWKVYLAKNPQLKEPQIKQVSANISDLSLKVDRDRKSARICRRFLRKALELLPEKDRELIEQRYGLYGEPKNHRELSEEFGGVRQAIHAKEKRILRDLRGIVLQEEFSEELPTN